jgi:hypothetical protein
MPKPPEEPCASYRQLSRHDMTDAFRGLYRTVAGAYGMTAFHVPEAVHHAFAHS